MSFSWRSLRVVAVAISLILGSVIAISTLPVLAQDDVDELEELKEERERIAREAASAVGQIDVVTASVDEVTEALDELQAFVTLQRTRLEEAERQYASALDAVQRAKDERALVLAEMEIVQAHLTELAVSSFTGEGSAQGEDMTELVLSDDPGESVRFLHLLELQTGSLSDGIDRLRLLEQTADQLVAAEDAAALDATESLQRVDERVAQLDEALAIQERVVTGAQIRLEAQIAEAAILEERDAELATEIKDQQASINRRVAVSARNNGVEIPDPVDLDDIVRVDFFEEVPEDTTPDPAAEPSAGDAADGEVVDTTEPDDPVVPPEPELPPEPFFSIEVHADIAEQTEALYQAAFDAGIDLGGWGYRPIQRQIELRAAHCGGTEYDIWHKPVFECAPPTARPGFSKHEQGRAIDFTLNGASITSKDSAGFRWLVANAPQYGFVNLDSEPWHWSIASGDERLPGAD